ncbi:Hypothetical protein EIN_435240, partial [Entamoeba invadens IP1]
MYITYFARNGFNKQFSKVSFLIFHYLKPKFISVIYCPMLIFFLAITAHSQCQK